MFRVYDMRFMIMAKGRVKFNFTSMTALLVYSPCDGMCRLLHYFHTPKSDYDGVYMYCINTNGAEQRSTDSSNGSAQWQCNNTPCNPARKG